MSRGDLFGIDSLTTIVGSVTTLLSRNWIVAYQVQLSVTKESKFMQVFLETAGALLLALSCCSIKCMR